MIFDYLWIFETLSCKSFPLIFKWMICFLCNIRLRFVTTHTWAFGVNSRLIRCYNNLQLRPYEDYVSGKQINCLAFHIKKSVSYYEAWHVSRILDILRLVVVLLGCWILFWNTPMLLKDSNWHCFRFVLGFTINNINMSFLKIFKFTTQLLLNMH